MKNYPITSSPHHLIILSSHHLIITYALTLLRFFFLLCLGSFTTLSAKVFEAYDQPSFKAAIDSVKKGNGGDTIKITANISIVDYYVYLNKDVTFTAETNPNGTPKYTVTNKGSAGVINVDVLNYLLIENLIFSEANSGVRTSFADANDDAEIIINNCIFTNHRSYGLQMFKGGGNAQRTKVTVNNCKANNNDKTYGTGISISGGIEYVNINNCECNNNNQGIYVFNVKNGSIKNCVTNFNSMVGISVSQSENFTVENCTSNENESSWGSEEQWGCGFSISGEKTVIGTKIINCTAFKNGTYGYYLDMCQAINCVADYSGWDGFWYWGILDKCLASNSGGVGFMGFSALISNSTAVNNGNDGIYGGCVINCTSANNKVNGINVGNSSRLGKVYNSISYGNGSSYNSDISSADIYNSVYGKTNPDSKPVNCSQEDPKLQGRTANGEVTGNPDEVAYFVLGEGSSALNLADASYITKENILQNVLEGVSENDADWYIMMITEELITNILFFDQNGNPRQITDNKYDAGSIASNEGGNNLNYPYSPKKVANFGKSTITFFGKKFDNSINFTLKKQGESNIVPEKVTVEYSEIAGMYKCLATFDFNNKKVGKWDIVISTADTTITIKNGLELETVIEPEIVLEIMGSPNIRNGATNSFIIKYTNKGNLSVYCQPIIVELITPKRVQVEVKEKWQSIYTEGVYKEKFATIDGVLHKLDTLHDFRGNNTCTTFITPAILAIPPYGTGYLIFDVKISVDDIADDPIEIKAYTLLPLATGSEDRGIGFKSGGISETLWGCLGTVAKIVWDVVKVPLGAIPGVGCAIQAGESLYSIATTEGSTGYKAANAAAEMGKTIAECASDIIPGGAAVKTALKFIQGVSTASDIVGHLTGLIECGSGLAKLFSRLIGSKDPNDKIGPLSASGSTAFSDRTEFSYMINFENDEKATAPAQEVWITDELDLNVFDINTFEAGIMKFGDTMVTDIPFGVQNHTWSVDMRPEMDLITEIKLTLNKSKGIATWYFKSLDPETGELTTDPLAGLFR